jgi:hypothetical protein
MSVGVVVQGYQELQAAAQKLVAAAQPSGALGKAVQFATLQFSRASRAARTSRPARIRARSYSTTLTCSVMSSSRRTPIPVSGSLASVYGPIEEARGGEHAAWATTMQQDAPGVMVQAAQIILASLP